MSLEVRGTGVIATLVRSVIGGFNGKHRIKTTTSNDACLPRPRELPGWVLAKIYGTYFGVWLMLFLGAYTQRARHAICAFFYRKREKRRVLYLYNETLRRRLGFFRFMRGRVRALVRARLLERDTDPWLALRLRSPRLCGWLGYFACARAKCLICGEAESRKGPAFRQCTTPGCPFVHCPECWRDVGRICYACTDLQDTDTDDYDTHVDFWTSWNELHNSLINIAFIFLIPVLFSFLVFFFFLLCTATDREDPRERKNWVIRNWRQGCRAENCRKFSTPTT